MKKIYVVFMILISSLLWVGCVNTNAYTIDQIEENVVVTYAAGDSQHHVTTDVTLPRTTTFDSDAFIFWVSDHPDIISHSGGVTRDLYDRDVTLTYMISYEGENRTGSITMTVIATNVTFTVTFDSNGGTPVDQITLSRNTIIIKPTDPTKEGFIFDGWYTNSAFTTTYLFGIPLTANAMLYAKWNDIGNIDYTGIYDGAEGKTGISLVNFLYTIVTSNITGKEQSYGEARYTLDDTDEDISNTNNVILVYLGTSVSGVWDAGSTWNREHVWPQSLLGDSADNGTINRASDLHNLKPANPSENSSRGNRPFDEESENYAAYEPRDEVKGDVARIIFYMAVRYHTVLTLVNLSNGQEPNTYEMGDLATLLLWNLEDPVDDFEMNRNDLIEDYQGNRNPFIDYPAFADLIWG